MTLLQNTAEGGSDSTAVTTGNSGGSSGDSWTAVVTGTGSIVYSSAQKQHGSLSYLVTTAASQATYLQWTPAVSATTCVYRFYVRFTGLPSGGLYFASWRSTSGGTLRCALGLNADGTLFFQDTNSATQYTSAGTISTNTWYRFEGSLSGPGAATGAAVLNTYLGDNSSSIANLSTSLTGKALGTTGFGQFRAGREAATASTQAPYYMDDIAFSDGTLTLLGPSSEVVTTPTSSPYRIGARPTQRATGLHAHRFGPRRPSGLHF